MHYQIWPFARASLRTREPLSCAIDDLGALIVVIRSLDSAYQITLDSAHQIMLHSAYQQRERDASRTHSTRDKRTLRAKSAAPGPRIAFDAQRIHSDRRGGAGP